MREYKIITPDGAPMTVEGPDDATDDELISFAQDQLRQRGNRFAETPVTVRPAETVAATDLERAAKRDGVQRRITAREALDGKGGYKDILENAALFGLSDEASGAADALINIATSPFTGELNPGQAYRDSRDAQRIRINDALARYPVTGLGAQIVGGFLGGAPRGALGAGAAAVDALAGQMTGRQAAMAGAKGGALAGGVAGFGGGTDTESSIVGGVLGAGLGGVLGGAAPAIGNFVGRTWTGLNRLLGRGQENVGRQIVADALAADANTGASAGALMDRSRELGVPAMLADTGENVRGLVASVGRKPGPSRTTVLNAVTERQRGQSDRIRGAIERDFGAITNQPVRAAELQAEARAAASAAREAGIADLGQSAENIGPNVDRLATGSQARDAFGRAYDAARARSNEAYNAPALINPQPIELPTSLFAQDIRSAADRFYGDGGGLMPAEVSGIIDDLAAEGATTRTLTNIDRRLADFAGREKVSGNRSDAAFAENVRRSLSDFVDRAAPAEYRSALANAKAVRAEQGRVFETRDLPRTFANDRFGNPMIGDTSVPERLVRPGAPGGDTADSLIAAVGPEQAEAIMRQELRRTLDSLPELTAANTRALNTRYAEAVQRFPSLANDLVAVNRHASTVAGLTAAEREAGREGTTAIERGYNALGQSPDEISRTINSLNETEVPLFGEGVRNQLANQISRRVDDADKARALIGSPNRRSVLERVFPGEGLDRFSETLAAEQAGNQTFRSVTAGSQTAERQVFDELTSDEGVLDSAVNAGIRGGGLKAFIFDALQSAREAGRFGTGEAGKNVRQSIASLLTETDPALLQQIIRDANADVLARQRAANIVNQGASLTGQQLGVGLTTAGSNLGR